MPRKKKEEPTIEQRQLALIESLEGMQEKRAEKNTRAKKAVTEKPKKPKKLTKKEQQIQEVAAQIKLPNWFHVIQTEEALRKLADDLRVLPDRALDTETMGKNPHVDAIVGVSVYHPAIGGYYIPLKHVTDDCITEELFLEVLKPVLEDPTKKNFLHNGKFDLHVFRRWLGIQFRVDWDSFIVSALLNENDEKALKVQVKYLRKMMIHTTEGTQWRVVPKLKKYTDLAGYRGRMTAEMIEDIGHHNLPVDVTSIGFEDIKADKYAALFGKVPFNQVPMNLAAYYAILDTVYTYWLVKFQEYQLGRKELAEIEKIYREIELPLLHILADAEFDGIPLDENYLVNEVGKKLEGELEDLKKAIFKHLGRVINLNAPQQLANSLFNKPDDPVWAGLGIREIKIKDKKTQQMRRSTDGKKVLAKLKKDHEVIPMVIDYKKKSKLYTAFVTKLPKSLREGRVHCSFNQVGTKTGRMSCSGPNLQQIPASVGPLIRSAFMADDGHLLVSIDFSGQELRWLAFFSKDPVLLKAFREGRDIHSTTAVSVWNVQHSDNQITYEYFQECREVYDKFTDKNGKYIEPTEEFNGRSVKELKAMYKDGKEFDKARKSAKVINFGIVYGMSEIALGDTLDVSTDEAKVFMNAYFAAYPGVKKWMDDTKKFVRINKFARTYLGRKRRLHEEMNSGVFWMEQKALRMGPNHEIQGSSADQVKKAMVDLQPLLKELDAKILLQVHDELVFKVPKSIGWSNLERMAKVMADAIQLEGVTFISDIEASERWGYKMKPDEVDDLAIREMMDGDITGGGGMGDSDDDDEEDVA